MRYPVYYRDQWYNLVLILKNVVSPVLRWFFSGFPPSVKLTPRPKLRSVVSCRMAAAEGHWLQVKIISRYYPIPCYRARNSK